MSGLGLHIEKYAARREASWKRVQAAYEFREGDCVATNCSAGGSYFSWLYGVDIAQYYSDIDTQIEVQSRALQWRYENLDDDFTGYGLHYDMGPIGEALVFDMGIVRPPNTSPWAVPFITDGADVERLQLKDPRHNPRVQEVLRQGERMKERAEKLGIKIPVAAAGVGIHPPLSCACALARPDWVYAMMHLEPDLIEQLFEKCYRAFCLITDYMHEVHGTPRGHLGLADDNSAFVSPDMYKDQVLPWNLRLYARYGRQSRYLHADGPNEHHFPVYAHVIRLNHHDIGGWSKLQPAVDILKPAGCVINGNLNCRDFYDGWTERLRTKIRQTIRLAAPGGGYIFAIGGETYPRVDPDALCRAFAYAHEVGQYPISIPKEEWDREPAGLARASASTPD